MKPNENLKPYFSKISWSDVNPFELVRTRANTIAVIRPMKVEKHPDWSPEIIPGGFTGHCVNQEEQKWLYESDPEGYEIEVRWSKARNAWFDKGGNKYYNANEPKYIYDFNF